MRIVYCAALCLLSSLSFACRQSPAVKQMPPRVAIGNVTRFGVQFSGEYRLAEMAPYQVMFLDPDQAGAHDADSISGRGGLPIAYVNIGEAEAYRWFYPDIRKEWMLAANPNWKDHFYIDVNKPEWHALLINKVLPPIFQKGFAGLFLDMIDVASPDVYPMLQPGVLSLIREIRAAYPEKVIVMNGGTFMAGAVGDLIDGIAVESVSATYDFGSRTYTRVSDDDAAARCAELQRLTKSLGVKIFAIDYAQPGDTLTARMAAHRSMVHGFLSFVGTIELNALPKPLD
jgi:uncharacterized protein (TIGR01370 family)